MWIVEKFILKNEKVEKSSEQRNKKGFLEIKR